jgi:TonB family protein
MPSLHLLSRMKRPLSAALSLMLIVLMAQAQTPATQTTPPKTPELAEASKLAAQVVEFYNKGRYDEALPLAKRSLEIREKALGPEHPLVGEALQNLASVQFGKKNYGEAQSLYKRALKIFEKAYGRDSIKLVAMLDNTGWLYVAQGNVGEAEDAFLRALALREKAFGPDGDEVTQSTYMLAQLYEQLGRYDKAVGYYKRTIAIKEKALGPNNEQLADYLDKSACALAATGQHKEAMETQSRAHDLRHQISAKLVKRVTGEVLQGKATSRFEPAYPLEAKQRRISGSVMVEATVDETGHVVAARALCGPPMLRDASVEAARQWRFTPTTVNGAPVKVVGVITFNFRL